jgi:cysteinyl-tRNA synthetase
MPALQLYDNYERKLREFIPQQACKASFYSCGPTVYDYQHIGNMRTYLFADGLKRVLRLNGLDVTHLMNVIALRKLTSYSLLCKTKMEKGRRATLFSRLETD